MPRLLAFICCEKALADNSIPGQESLSAITILQGVRLAMPAGSPKFPENATLAFPWAAVCVWARVNAVEDSFQCRIVVLSPTGEELVRGEGEPKFGGNLQAKHLFRFQTIPVGRLGLCTIRLMTRMNSAQPWVVAMDYPFEIISQAPDPANPGVSVH